MDFIQKIKVLFNLSGKRFHGYKESEISNTENNLGIKFPKILRDYYLSIGKNEKINGTFNRLLEPKKGIIGFTDDGNYLVFYEENECDAYWAIERNDLEKNNPKVYGNYYAGNCVKDWVIDSETMERFLLSMAYWNGVLGGLKYNANYSNDDGIKNSIIKNIENNWEEIKKITNQRIRFFANDNMEIIAVTTDFKNNANGIYYGTNKKEAFFKTLEIINIKWDYRSDEDE